MKEKPIYISPECMRLGVEAENVLCNSLVSNETKLQYNEQFTQTDAIW